MTEINLSLRSLAPHEIKRYRVIMRMDVRDFATAMGVTERSVWRWESGERTMPRPSAALLLRMVEDHRLAQQPQSDPRY